MTSTTSAALSVATATLQPPGSVTASASCPNAKLGTVTVTWSPSASTFLGGYTVTRSVNGGTPAVVASVSPSTTSYADTSVAGRTTYTYAVVATYAGWTSSAVSVTLTTPSRC